MGCWTGNHRTVTPGPHVRVHSCHPGCTWCIQEGFPTHGHPIVRLEEQPAATSLVGMGPQCCWDCQAADLGVQPETQEAEDGVHPLLSAPQSTCTGLRQWGQSLSSPAPLAPPGRCTSALAAAHLCLCQLALPAVQLAYKGCLRSFCLRGALTSPREPSFAAWE